MELPIKHENYTIDADKFGITITFTVDDMRRIRKALGINTITLKRAVKLLMSAPMGKKKALNIAKQIKETEFGLLESTIRYKLKQIKEPLEEFED